MNNDRIVAAIKNACRDFCNYNDNVSRVCIAGGAALYAYCVLKCHPLTWWQCEGKQQHAKMLSGDIDIFIVSTDNNAETMVRNEVQRIKNLLEHEIKRIQKYEMTYTEKSGSFDYVQKCTPPCEKIADNMSEAFYNIRKLTSNNTAKQLRTIHVCTNAEVKKTDSSECVCTFNIVACSVPNLVVENSPDGLVKALVSFFDLSVCAIAIDEAGDFVVHPRAERDVHSRSCTLMHTAGVSAVSNRVDDVKIVQTMQRAHKYESRGFVLRTEPAANWMHIVTLLRQKKMTEVAGHPDVHQYRCNKELVLDKLQLE